MEEITVLFSIDYSRLVPYLAAFLCCGESSRDQLDVMQVSDMQVSFGNRKITTVQSLKFWGLTIDTTLTWKHYIGELTSRLNKACYAIRSIRPFMSIDILRSTYFSYARSIISYGIIFWGNSFYSEHN